MTIKHFLRKTFIPHEPIRYVQSKNIWYRYHIDLPLFLGLLILAATGLVILYSAANQNSAMVWQQVGHLGLAFFLMFFFAQIPPIKYQTWAPWLFLFGVFLLIAVLIMGKIGKGAQRWLDLGIIRFQPSEIAKLAVPMMLAWFYHHRKLPPTFKDIVIATILLGIPTLLTAKQPDLGTALLIAFSGCAVILLAGIHWRWIISIITLTLATLPIVWHFLRTYQQQRVLTFLNPERDPLGSGYHIIQSKIAIGSGGIFGKGWLNGTQSHLHFLPEHATDFIFAVVGEEFGLIGATFLLVLFLYITARCLYISSQAQDTFTRLLTGSITLSFFIAYFINIGMVTGIIPVVGLPLPLISYGGTSMVTICIGFGILMSTHTHRKLLST
ncbi:MAG: rod shape-determining protein RodA [Legionellales bacterium]|nr:rod shape-determining protein RodA [Legionellales bacterium]